MTRVLNLGGQAILACGNALDCLQECEQPGVVVLDPPFEFYDPEWIMNLEAALPEVDHMIIFSKFPYTGLVQTQFKKLPLVAEFIWHYTDMCCYRAQHMPLIHHETISIFSRRKSDIDMDAIRTPHAVLKRPKFTTRKSRGKEGKPLHWEPDDKGAWPSSVIAVQRSLDGELLGEAVPTGVKPVELLQRLLPAFPGRILDPFMGSGSVGVAAMKLGRDYEGIEIDVDRFNVAATRITHARAQGDLFATS